MPQLIPGGGATGTGFGTDMPGQPQRVDPGGAFSNAGQGALAVGAALGGIAADMREREQVQQRAQSALALAKITNDLHAAHDEVGRGVMSGDIDADKAGAELESRARSIVSDGMEGLRPEQRAEITAHAEGTFGVLGRSLTNVVVARKQAEVGATVDQFDEQLQRQVPIQGPKWASERYDAMVDTTAGAAGWSPLVAQKKKQAFAEKSTYSFFDGAGTEALSNKDAEGVAAVRELVQGPDGEAMDPIRRSQLTHQLFGYEQHILGQRARDANLAEEAQRLRENTASTFYNQARDITIHGGTFSPDFIKAATSAAAAAGPDYERDLGGLLSGQSPLTGFATKSADDRAAILERFRAGRNTPGVGTDPGQDKALNELTTIDTKLREAYKENPWQAAQQSGRITDAPLINAGAPQDAIGIIQSRMANITSVEQGAGYKVSPLQPQEAEQMGKVLRTLPSDQAMTLLSTLAKTVNDPERIEAMALQFDKGHKPIALAMKFGADQTTAGRYLGQLILDGAQALGDKTVKADDAKLSGWHASIAEMVRGSIGDKQVESDAIEAAYLVRASMDAKGIALPGYNLTASNENAVKMVIGQPLERGGAKTVLPRGMDEHDFDNKLRDFTPDRLRAMVLPTEQFAAGGRTPAPTPSFFVRGQPMSPEALSIGLTNYGFQKASGGRYVPIRGNALVTLDKEGTRPLFLEVN